MLGIPEGEMQDPVWASSLPETQRRRQQLKKRINPFSPNSGKSGTQLKVELEVQAYPPKGPQQSRTSSC